MTAKVMFSLPDALVSRMKSMIPGGERSRIVAAYLEKVVDEREHLFYEQALKLEANEGLREEMKEWDQAFIDDGLDNV